MIPKLLVPIDESPTAQRTIDAIIESKNRFPKHLTLLHVINSDQLVYRMIPDAQLDMVRQNALAAAQQLLKNVDQRLQDAGFAANELLIEFGDPRQTIANIANDRDFQLLVIGRHEGGGEIRDVIFGSVANHVLHNVKCPVLLF